MDGRKQWQPTKYKYGASNPKWSVNGKQLLFTLAIRFQKLLMDSVLNRDRVRPAWPYKRPGFIGNDHFIPDSVKGNPDGNTAEIRNYLQNNEADKKAIVLNTLNFKIKWVFLLK